MSNDSVSDVNPDDLEQMIKGIDDLDDDLFGRPKKKDLPTVKSDVTETIAPGRRTKPNTTDDDLGDDLLNDLLADESKPTNKSILGSSKSTTQPSKIENKSKVMGDIFGNDSEEQTRPKPKNRAKIDLDFGDDDILGSLDSKPPKAKSESKNNFMDDIFGSKPEKEKKSSFLDDILGNKDTTKSKDEPAPTKSEFTLDSKYKKTESPGGFDFGEPEANPQPRRRRGNPTVGATKPPSGGDIFENSTKKTDANVVPNDVEKKEIKNKTVDNPFPWMSANSQSTTEKTNTTQNTIQAPVNTTQPQNQPQTQPPPTLPTQNQQPPPFHQQPIQTIQQPQQIYQQQQQTYHQPAQNLQPLPVFNQTLFQTDMTLDTQQQEQFNRDMDAYTKMMNDRRAEHASALEKQRQQLSEHIQQLQNKQNQMSRMQAEQGQRLLQRLQQQIEEETSMKQKLMTNQLQMLTKLQMDAPSQEIDIVALFEKTKTNIKSNIVDQDDKKTGVIKLIQEKTDEVEEIYKTKESKLIENYEQVIKDLENKLDVEQDRYRQLVEHQKEEREKVLELHKEEIKQIKDDNRTMQESMKSDYLTAIQSLKELRKIEMDSAQEINETTWKLSKITSTVDTNTKDMNEIASKLEKEMTEHYQSKEQELQHKDRELAKLQETLIKRQESSDIERKTLTELILKLEGQVHEKQLEIESEKRELLYEKEQHEFSKKQFGQERDALLENLKREKNKIYLDRDKVNLELDKMKTELSSQLKKLKIERSKYYLHQRLYPDDQELKEELKMEGYEVESMLKAVEEEKKRLTREKENIKEHEKKLYEKKKKITSQRKDLANAIEKLYEVEKGISEKFKDLERLKNNIIEIKMEGIDSVRQFRVFEDGMVGSLQDIQSAIVELLKQEQKIKSEKMSLTGERKKLQNTRQSLICSTCSRTMKRSISSRDIRNLNEFDGVQYNKIRHGGSQMAWMDIEGSTLNRVKSRTSGDGASLEALDSHVSAYKKDAENDQQFLRDEMEYLKSIQGINMRTLSKYQ